MNAVLSALANGLVLSALLAAVVWVALRLLKRSFNAATRYVIWWIALLATVALPVFYLAAANQRRIEPARASHGTTEIVPTRSVASPSASLSVTGQPASTTPSWLPGIPIHIPSSPWTERFGELWALISLLLLARLGAGFAALHFQKKYAREASPDLRELSRELMERRLTGRGIRRRVRVALIPEGNSPMLAGVIRPCVLIPERLLPELDRAELEQIFLHEATHAARYDDWALLLQRVIQALFVFYPVVHWMARRINLEREAACDADVISITGDPRAYAKCLTHVAELSLGDWKSPLAAAIADEKSYLTRRIAMLMDKNRHTATRLLTLRLALSATVVCLLAVLAATSPAFFVSAQSPDTASDWEKAAGGKLSFEVASVKENKSFLDPRSPHAFWGFGEKTPPGGLLRAVNMQLSWFIEYAYKLDITQERSLSARMPKWARETGYDIEARTQGGLPQDQARLMMQSLLADRFKLAVHFETNDGPAYALVLAKAGKLGSQMRAFPDGFPCSESPTSAPTPEGGVGRGGDAPHPTVPAVDDGRLPAWCGGILALPPIETGIMHQAGRNVSVDALIQWISLAGNLDRPLVDRTGLSGTFDVTLDIPLPVPPGADAAAAPPGTMFLEAVSDQLGLKLQSITAPVPSLIIDHVEEPSPN